ncbi:MAG TPA: AMP-dependent synthetase/ligase [Mycobacteriales bacterium]
MREFSAPPAVTVPDDARLTDVVFDHAASDPDLVSFSRRRGGRWVDVTAADFAAEVTGVAKGLLAAGIGAGDRVAVMSATRYEWTLLDYAIWTAGAISVPIYETSSAEQVRWTLGDSGAVAAVVETAAHAAIVASVAGDLPKLHHVWTIDSGGVAALTTGGTDVADREVEQRRRAVRLDDLATIIYTSGTTGRPKGCELTQRNLLTEVMTAVGGLPPLFRPGAATLLFLPIAHVLGRVIQCGAIYAKVRLGHTADVKNLLEDLREFRPTFILAVPRVFEKVYNTAKQRAHIEGKGRIFDVAERVAVRYSQALDDDRVPVMLDLQHRVFDRLVYSRLRAALGGQCTAAISGGAPLGARLGHFFRGIGLPVFEGYGLTESTAACCLNLEGAVKIGTVGRPIPGVSIRIAGDGEILLKGDVISDRYWQNDEATEQSRTDGWFRTGDIGDLDDDGFLRITGRKKELIVTAGGKNVAPAALEDRLRAHPLISQCMVVGDNRPYIAALITLDPDALPAWRDSHGKPADSTAGSLRDDPDLNTEIQRAVDQANAAVSRAEGIRRFRIVPDDFTVESGELTPSLKLKRTVVLERHDDDMVELYG